MRIGIDMLPVQSPGSRTRGVGRYGRGLVAALIKHQPQHDYVLYFHSEYLSEDRPEYEAARRITLCGETIRQSMNDLVDENPEKLDLLVTLNPFELCPGYDPPTRGRGPLNLAAVVYDFIPFLDQEHYLAEPGNAALFYQRLQTIARYDHLFAISDATKDDATRLMGSGLANVTNISGAAESAFFQPNPSQCLSFSVRRTLCKQGIRRPYVLSVAGSDERKNVRSLIDGFSQLPLEIRISHQLVIACHLPSVDATRLRLHAENSGLADELILTGEISDDDLRILYQHCAVFGFPSLFEGLGLPLLEAMHCGAPVLAGANSSQFEVVGDAGLLVNASDPSDISRGLETLLTNPEKAADFATKGIEQAKDFRWERSASRLVQAIESEFIPPRRTRRDPAHQTQGRIAVFSPFRPKKSGISSYTEWLVGELAKRYRIDLYHDSGYVPDLGLPRDGFSTFDYRLWERRSQHRRYDAILYQMGNSIYHGFLYETMLKYPGIVTLHDFSLAGFQYWRASQFEDAEDVFAREVERCEPDRHSEILQNLPEWRNEPGSVQEAFTRRGIALNHSVLETSKRVVLHSPSLAGQIDESLRDKIAIIPHGAWPLRLSGAAQREARHRLSVSDSDLLFGSFGFLSQAKMNVEAIQAFASILPEIPSAQFLFVGQDCEAGEARREAERLGISGRVRFFGHCSDLEFDAVLAAIDIGVSLRRPPTYGETSGALLNLLRRGIPTIVTDVGTFSDYLDDVVRKVRADDSIVSQLADSMRTLARDLGSRRELGERAFQHVTSHHSWPKVTDLYAELIVESASMSGTHSPTIQSGKIRGAGSARPIRR